jgi:predicted Fe-S protein YdhL (DUF1289 family)
MNSARQLLLEKARQLDAAAPIPSPCISVCRIEAGSGLCEGCLRTLDEIAAWSSLDEPGRREVWRRLEQRAAGTAP